MLRVPRFLVVAVFIFFASAWGSASAAVVNGGFETPIVTGGGPPAGWGFDYRTGSDLTGWTIFAPNNGIVHFNSGYTPGMPQPVGAGLQSIQLEYANDYIEQSIATAIGQNYLLSFMLSAYFNPGVSLLEVEIDGNPAGTFAGTFANYVTYNVPFVASSASTLIHFENGGPEPYFSYPHLDNISVSAVPEPGTAALLGAAVGAFGLSRRRKSLKVA